jgi:SAM-dependent methyltransferase
VSLKSGVLAFASQRMPSLSRRVLASAGYTIHPDRLAPESEYGVWNSETAERQDRAWRPLVAAAEAGDVREDIAALYDALDPIRPFSTVLETGCGGGYYAELIAHHYPDAVYRGLDISPAMIELARAHYPDREFVVGSAYELPFADDSQDVVVDGVALIHMPSWQRAVPEYARVARSHVVLHGLTLTDSAPTTLFAKYAYGQPSLESVFARSEVEAACAAAGLERVAITPGLDYDLEPYLGIPSVSETWVLRVS